MEFRKLFKNLNDGLEEESSYMILSTGSHINKSDFENVIQIIDESGTSLTCTRDKFVEIFDKEGLSGFII